MKIGFSEIKNLTLRALEGRSSLCRWDGERGILQYVVAFDRSRIQYADGLVSVTGDSLTSHLFFPLTANRMDRGGMLAMAEFLAYASSDLLPGRFELDSRDGLIRYRLTFRRDGLVPTRKMVENAIRIPHAMMERYGDGILDVLYSARFAEQAAGRWVAGTSPRDALVRIASRGLSAGGRSFLPEQWEEDEEDDVLDAGFLAS